MKINYSNQTFGKQNTPRYIYHLTNRRAYNSMLSDGFIRVADKDPYNSKPSIYALDLVNFLKFWGHHKSWNEKGEPLQESLLRAAANWSTSLYKGRNDLIILRIPTKQLDPDKLKIRSQHMFFETLASKTKIRFSQLDEVVKRHLQCFTPASKAKLYTEKKQAIEYIYQEKIPIDMVTKIGKIINIPELRKNPDFQINDHVKFILTHLLEGTKEANLLRFLKR